MNTTRQPGIDVPLVVEFILDETGSMISCKNDVILGFNTFIREQKAQSGNCQITLTKFDTTGIKTPYLDLDINMVPEMTPNTFNPGAGTNLFDAIGDRIKKRLNIIEHWDNKPNVLVIVMTDGDENASKEFKESHIKNMINENLNWTFVFLASCDRATSTAKRLGFRQNNIKLFETDNTAHTYTELSNATSAYRSNACSVTENFFNSK